MLPLNTFLTSLHKKAVVFSAIFYNSEIDKSIDNVYNTIYICMRKEDSPHNANYVMKGAWRDMKAVFLKIRHEEDCKNRCLVEQDSIAASVSLGDGKAGQRHLNMRLRLRACAIYRCMR